MAVQTVQPYHNCLMVSFGNVKDVIVAKIVEERLNNTHIVTVLNSTRNRHVFMGTKQANIHAKLKDASFMYKIFKQKQIIHSFWVYNYVSSKIGSLFVDNLIQFLMHSKFSVDGADVYFRKIEPPRILAECTSVSDKNPQIEETLLSSRAPKSKDTLRNRKLKDVKLIIDQFNHITKKSSIEIQEKSSLEMEQVHSNQVEPSAPEEFAKICELPVAKVENNKVQPQPQLASQLPQPHRFTCTKLQYTPALPHATKEAQETPIPPLVYFSLRKDSEISSSKAEQNLKPVQPTLPASRQAETKQNKFTQVNFHTPTAVVQDDNCDPSSTQSNEVNVSPFKDTETERLRNSERNDLNVLKYAFNVLTICARRAKIEMFHLPTAADVISSNTPEKALINNKATNIEQQHDDNVSTESISLGNEDNDSIRSNTNSTLGYEFRNPSPENQLLHNHDRVVGNSRNHVQAIITKSKEINARNASDESYNSNESTTNSEIYIEQRKKYLFDDADIGTRSWKKQRSHTPTSSASTGNDSTILLCDSTIEIRVDHSKLSKLTSVKSKTEKKQRYTCKEMIQPTRKRPICGNGSNRIDPLQLLKVRTVKPMSASEDQTEVKKKRIDKPKQSKIEKEEKVYKEINKTRDCSVKLVPLEKLIMQDMRSKN